MWFPMNRHKLKCSIVKWFFFGDSFEMNKNKIMRSEDFEHFHLSFYRTKIKEVHSKWSVKLQVHAKWKVEFESRKVKSSKYSFSIEWKCSREVEFYILSIRMRSSREVKKQRKYKIFLSWNIQQGDIWPTSRCRVAFEREKNMKLLLHILFRMICFSNNRAFKAKNQHFAVTRVILWSWQ